MWAVGVEGRGCLTCPTMDSLPRRMTINDFNVKLDITTVCSTESIIYIAICNNCIDKPGKDHYIGKSFNSVRERNNGHRNKFSISKFAESALSYHTHDDHLDKFPMKLANYSFGVLRHGHPMALARLEDYYVEGTQAETKGLNRYKVMI